MYSPATTSVPRREEPLDAVLRPIHNSWIEETRRFLDPATEPGADFWTRWAAVRYLSDDFRAGIASSARWSTSSAPFFVWT